MLEGTPDVKATHARGLCDSLFPGPFPIAGERVGLNGARPVPIEMVADFAPQAGLRRSD
jgi:hypothetical protein